MSLILEALKKSEQQRRLGEAPTLGSPVVSTRRRRSALPVIALLIVVAAGAGWWLMRKPVEPPAVPAPPVTAEKNVPGKPPGANATKPAETAAAMQDRVRQDAMAKRKAEQAKRIEALGNAKTNPPLGLPGAANQAAPPVQRKLGDPLPHTVPGVKTPPAAAPAATVPPKTDATAAAPKADATAKPATPPPAPAHETAAATSPAPAKAPAAAAPDAAALPTIWELPFSTRKDIPALELSMHVYSSDPKQRFVVVKGERHVEGDEIAADLVLKEIRQDGLVLVYKGQTFFFPRNGR